jgi:hypothetical protein
MEAAIKFMTMGAGTHRRKAGALARQSKDTAMWVHLSRLVGAHCGLVLRLRYGSLGF